MSQTTKNLFTFAVLLIVACLGVIGWYMAVSWPSLTNEEVKNVADVYAQKEGYNLAEFQQPTLKYDWIAREWTLFYEQIPVTDPEAGQLLWAPGKHFIVFVDDRTGQVKHLGRGA